MVVLSRNYSRAGIWISGQSDSRLLICALNNDICFIPWWSWQLSSFCCPVNYLVVFAQLSRWLVQILIIQNGHNEKQQLIAWRVSSTVRVSCTRGSPWQRQILFQPCEKVVAVLKMLLLLLVLFYTLKFINANRYWKSSLKIGSRHLSSVLWLHE